MSDRSALRDTGTEDRPGDRGSTSRPITRDRRSRVTHHIAGIECCCDHLPLHRQSQQIYAREGIDLDRSTLIVTGWSSARQLLDHRSAQSAAMCCKARASSCRQILSRRCFAPESRATRQGLASWTLSPRTASLPVSRNTARSVVRLLHRIARASIRASICGTSRASCRSMAMPASSNSTTRPIPITRLRGGGACWAHTCATVLRISRSQPSSPVASEALTRIGELYWHRDGDPRTTGRSAPTGAPRPPSDLRSSRSCTSQLIATVEQVIQKSDLAVAIHYAFARWITTDPVSRRRPHPDR